MIEQAAEMYCRPPQRVECSVYRVEGKQVLKVDIAHSDAPPVLAPDEDGRWRAYYRVADENVVASDLHVKVWRQRNGSRPTVLAMTESERTLIAHIEAEGDITLHDYSRLSVVNLCAARVLALHYRGGVCYITSAPGEPSHNQQ